MTMSEARDLLARCVEPVEDYARLCEQDEMPTVARVMRSLAAEARAALAGQAPEPAHIHEYAKDGPCMICRAPPEPPAPACECTEIAARQSLDIPLGYHFAMCPTRAPTPPACTCDAEGFAFREDKHAPTCPAAGRGGGR